MIRLVEPRTRAQTTDPIGVYFVLLPDTLLLDLAGPAEAFRLANRHLELSQLEPAFTLRFVGAQTQQSMSVGLVLQNIEPLPKLLPLRSWLVLLGQTSEGLKASLNGHSPAWLTTRDWLNQQRPALMREDAQNKLITVCSGSVLAADAGLLANCRCTTHHELLDHLQTLAPSAEVVNNRVFVVDGPQANIATSAGVTAGIDLALHLIAQTCGEDIAASVAQDMVVYLRRGPRDPELSPLLQHRNHMHPAVHRVQDAVNQNPQYTWTTQELAAAAHVTERHLLRLFTEHAGVSPSTYVETIRLEHARRALHGGASVTAAASGAGFNSDLQLRRAWARQLGGTPADARRRIG
jgi:transcriptional regulator GlxA family with amidase domain